MDIRAPILAVLVGGTPAPGINSVINAVTLEAINDGCRVIGIKEGAARQNRQRRGLGVEGKLFASIGVLDRVLEEGEGMQENML